MLDVLIILALLYSVEGQKKKATRIFAFGALVYFAFTGATWLPWVALMAAIFSLLSDLPPVPEASERQRLGDQKPPAPEASERQRLGDQKP